MCAEQSCLPQMFLGHTAHYHSCTRTVTLLLVGRQVGHTACKKLTGGVPAWLSVWSEVQTHIWCSWCHCHSLSPASVKSRLILPFYYWLIRVVRNKGLLNRCVCIIVKDGGMETVKVTVAENSSIFLIRMHWLLSARHAGSNTLHLQLQVEVPANAGWHV